MKNFFFLLVFSGIFNSVLAQKNALNLIVGTYTNNCESNGIYVFEFNTKTAESKLKSNTVGIINPSYLSIAENNKQIYSVNENGAESTVSAFVFDAISGKMNFLNKQSAEGADPCYIISDEQNVIVANYSGGTISVFGINPDGSLTKAKQTIQLTGKGTDPQRQQSPHAHMVYFSPDHKYVLANDLGTDKVYSYSYNPNQPTDILKLSDAINVKPGSGPRHLTFSKNGKYVYLLQELNGALTVYKYDKGILSKIDETSVLAYNFKGISSAAAIHLSPDGKFLYASNRGEANTITIFKIEKDGNLKLIGRNNTLGKGPRDFVIDPTGNFLLVANQYSNEIVIFNRDKITGLLTDSGKRIAQCAPVCMVFTNIE